jgi:hypothetical protein
MRRNLLRATLCWIAVTTIKRNQVKRRHQRRMQGPHKHLNPNLSHLQKEAKAKRRASRTLMMKMSRSLMHWISNLLQCLERVL